ncbi:MAG: YdcH family protein [Hyphomonadaceae bacterium]|nr:YdcH family protein [Hyphomonadaceae bacterium]
MIQRFQALHRRHATLDGEIQREQARPAPDAAKLRELKSRKLRIKDMINASGREEVRG